MGETGQDDLAEIPEQRVERLALVGRRETGSWRRISPGRTPGVIGSVPTSLKKSAIQSTSSWPWRRNSSGCMGPKAMADSAGRQVGRFTMSDYVYAPSWPASPG